MELQLQLRRQLEQLGAYVRTAPPAPASTARAIGLVRCGAVAAVLEGNAAWSVAAPALTAVRMPGLGGMGLGWAGLGTAGRAFKPRALRTHIHRGTQMNTHVRAHSRARPNAHACTHTRARHMLRSVGASEPPSASTTPSSPRAIHPTPASRTASRSSPSGSRTFSTARLPYGPQPGQRRTSSRRTRRQPPPSCVRLARPPAPVSRGRCRESGPGAGRACAAASARADQRRACVRACGGKGCRQWHRTSD